MNQTLFLAVTAQGIAISRSDNPSALCQIALTGDYIFDDNAKVTIKVTDDKSFAAIDDPLNNLVFKIIFKDKIDDSVIASLTGRMYVGGGIEALEEKYSANMQYIAQKLDFYGALDGEADFFDVVETRYDKSKAADIKAALTAAGVMNTSNNYRSKEKTLDVPASQPIGDITPEHMATIILKMSRRPNYLTMTDVSSLPMVEAMAGVMNKLNIHAFLDVGNMTDWQNVVALVASLSLDDQRFRVLWNPNKSRPSNAKSVLSRQKWRPCVGDYLAKHLLRNALVDVNGIPPIHIPVAGYSFPVGFKSMKQLDGVDLSEEAQNALARAKVIVVLNEHYDNGAKWIYGDVLTQRNSASSALRLANAAEIETYTANGVIGITKKHMFSPMSDYLQNAYDDCESFLNNCVTRGLLKPSVDLNGKYYALQLTPRSDKPFEAVNIKFSRRPEGAARQAYLDTTINK